MTESGPPGFPETGIVLPDTADRTAADLLAFAERADRAGVDSVWAWEGWGYNPFALLGRAAERTDCWLGTAICNGFARSPATLAMGAATLADATDGRFVLGIGTSTPSVVEELHGKPFDQPLRRLRETFEILDRALAGKPVTYDGRVFDLSGYELQHSGAGEGVPVWNAALGRTNVAMTLEYADGLLPNLLPFEAIPDAVTAGAERAGLADPDVHVAPMVPTCVDADEAAARRVLARHIAYYVGAVEFYNAVVSRHGYAETASAVADAWEAGDREAAADAVTPELMDAVGVAGTPTDAREGFAELLAGPADTVLASFPDGLDDEMVRAGIDALAAAAR
ncbi:MAG: LLM class flavin-dependent oxidoreductase [Halolamina sp.]